MAKTTQHNYAAKLKAAILNAAITGKLTGGTTGWKTVKLGEIFDVARGGSPRPIKDYITTAENGLNWIKIGDTVKGSKYITSVQEKIKPEGLHKTRQVYKGDLLLSNSMSFGEAYILNIDGCIHDGWLVLHPKQDLSRDFFVYLLSAPSTHREFESLASGTGVRNLNSEKVRSISIPLPPLAVQKEIVGKVEELMGLVEVVRKGGAKIRELGAKARAKILDRAIHGKLVAQDPADPPPSAPAATTTPPYPIPPNWKWVTLGEMADVQLGKMLDKAKTNGKEYRYLANISVRWGSFDLENLKTTFFTEREVEKFALQKGDILMCEGGEPGRCAIWKEKDSGIKYQKALHRIRLVGDLPEYVCIYFEAVHDSQLFVNRLTGSTIKHLPRERLIEMLIPLPPVAEQRRIVAKVEALLAVVETLTTPR